MIGTFYSFGGGQFRPVQSDSGTKVPVPRPESPDQWGSIPYGGPFLERSSTILHTIWQVEILIPNEANYTIIAGLLHNWGTLVMPYMTKTAYLRSLLISPQWNGKYRGTATWEWK